jgi:orotate phosphoribosyltransferase
MDVIEEIEKVGGYYNSPDHHFEYQSGEHGYAYLDMDPLFPHQRQIREVCRELAYPFVGDFDAVVGSATGGIPLAAIVAEQRRTPVMVWADKVGKDDSGRDIFAFARPGFSTALKGRHVLYVEDILNTGGTSQQTIQLIQEAGGEVIAAACVCNRGSVTAEILGVPELHELSKVNLETFEQHECPACAKEIPMITDVAHGAQFRRNSPRYTGGFRRLLTA